MDWKPVILAAVYLVGYASGWLAHEDKFQDAMLDSPARRGGIHTYTVAGDDMKEKVACEFDEPLKYLDLIMHDYDTNEEMYVDYITLAKPVEHEEIWGWSNCSWQPEDSWAACDVYYVKPEFVHADMNIDTIGHEVEHALCGDYHE